LERARWLDELTNAISQAQGLAWRLDCEEARQLYARLEAVRAEVSSLRFGDWTTVRKEIDPKWLESLIDGCGPGAGHLRTSGQRPRVIR
jgi:hypothetical protein